MPSARAQRGASAAPVITTTGRAGRAGRGRPVTTQVELALVPALVLLAGGVGVLRLVLLAR